MTRVKVTAPNDLVGSRIALSVSNLLAETSPKYLAGLDWILVIHADSLSRTDRIRIQRRGDDQVLATYFPRVRRKRAHIEIYTVGMQRSKHSRNLLIPAFRDVFVARVLFHELGHHIASEIEPAHANLEAVAETWRRKLADRALRARFPTLYSLLPKLMRRTAE